MSDTVTIETQVLERKFSEFLAVLNGLGAQPGDLSRALTTEAGQCAWRIANQLGPHSSEEARHKLDRDMKQYLTTTPAYSNLSDGQQYSSTSEFTWLTAGPNYLVGVNDEDDQTGAGVTEGLEFYYGSRNAAPRGKARVELGQRGKQHLYRLNRTRVSKSTFSGIRKAIADRFGQSKAAWLRVAAKYLPAKRIPAWVRVQIDRVIGNGKSVLDDQTTGPLPFITFGSRAPGVESNPTVRKAIAAGAVQSRETLKAKIVKVLAGHTYNWNTGQVFRPTVFEDN